MHTKWHADMGFGPILTTAIIAVSGADAETFLQGQLTVNLNDVTFTMSQLGAHCNIKGRMQALFRLIKIQKSSEETSYYLLTPKEQSAIALQNLKKYAIFSKVSLNEVSDSTLFGLVGQQAPAFLANILQNSTFNTLPIGGCIAAADITVWRVQGKTPRFEILVPHQMADALGQKCQSQTMAIGNTEWDRLDIEAGIPAVYPTTLDALLPHHANLTDLQAIGFNKGCYLGQEIIARMHYKGKIKRHMYRALLAEETEAPCPGDQIVVSDAPTETPGIVVRAAPCNTGFELLVILDDKYADFDKIHFKKADGPKLDRLDLFY